MERSRLLQNILNYQEELENLLREKRQALFKTKPQKKPKKKQEESKKKNQAKKPSLLGSYNDQLTLTNELLEPGADEEHDDDEMGVADTYADYMPSKLKLGGKHPDPVVETTSLSSVEPADIWYTLSLPDRVIESGALSALQLESITYAAQQHEHFLPDGMRAGFLIGDGAGVGKGRTIAGSIYENFLKGRKRAIWVSVSSDLKYDSQRDLTDIGATGVQVYSLSKMKYAAISSQANGYIKEGVIFSTYSALIGKTSQRNVSFKTRLDQLIDWCGDDFDGLIVFDECHRAKNLCPAKGSKATKTGITVLDIQQKLPKARVLYASATGASEPRNMAYMTRLGIWGHGTPFQQFSDFISSVEMRGVGAMEIVAMDMKLRGIYIARQLSFHGVTFKIEEIPLSADFVKVYDDSVLLWVELMQKFQEAEQLTELDNKKRKTMWAQFWASHQRFFKYLCIAAKVKHAVQVAKEAVNCGNCVVIGLQSTGEARTLDSLEKEGGQLSDFISTAKGVLENLVEKHFPIPESAKISLQSVLELGPLQKMKLNPLCGFSSNKIASEEGTSKGTKRKALRQTAIQAVKRIKEDASNLDLNTDSSDELSTHSTDDDYLDGISIKSNTSSNVSSLEFDSDSEDISKQPNNKQALCMRKDLLVKINQLGELLPPNTLDQLINELGGPRIVAEMTGRKGRVVQLESGRIQYETRIEEDITLETLNLTEKRKFMNGEKLIAIISEAASSGISLQSDRRVINKRKRVHITLELPWSADRAIQQFGRTHRSNQVNAPEYIFLISNIAGERRFASIVAKRLESLGALTHGDRRATETRDLSRYNIVNKYGREALKTTMATIVGHEVALVKPPSETFFEDISKSLVGVGLINNPLPDVHILDKDHDDISKFLNRILGMSVEHQNQLFKYFTDTLDVITLQAKKAGKYDLGILDLGKAGENVKRVKLFTFLRKHATGLGTTELHIVHVERGMSWEDAMKRWAELDGTHEGFYLSHQIRSGKKTAILAVCSDKVNKLYTMFRPNTGLQLRQETLEELQRKYKKVGFEAAEKSWTMQYVSSETTCSHAYWGGRCSVRALGLDCEVGLRRRTYNVLSGSVLAVWTRVEEVLKKSSYNQRMQVVRLRIADDTKVVGTLIPNSSVNHLCDRLAEDAEKMEEEVF